MPREMMTMRDAIVSARRGDLETDANGVVVQEFCFRADDPTFAGHFPTRPILPGIFQLEMARMLAEKFLKYPVAIREITKAKFLSPIVPEEQIRLELKLIITGDTIQARATFSAAGRKAGETILQLAKH